MTSISSSDLDQAIAKFQSLPSNDQLTALGLLFKEISGSIPADTFSSANSSGATTLIEQIQSQSSDEQVQTLGAFLSSKAPSKGEVALDPNPSKAMLELIPGNPDPTRPGVAQYKALDANARLAFWYQLGQQFSDRIPADAALSGEAAELATSLGALSPEQQASFLSQLT